jgi:hypothetical protein
VNPAESPLFIIGNCRSGTTLLRVMMSAHPRIYVTHEASFYTWAALFSRRTPREFLEYYFQTPEFRWLRVPPARVRAGLPDPLPPERLKDAFTAVMREKAAQYGRVRFGDKTPLHSRHLARIFEDFPDARVIHILRDPRTRVRSLSRMPFAASNLFANAFTSELDLHNVWRFQDRLLQIRMEDLLADPQATMGRVLAHVGEPWDDAVLDHVHRHPDKTDMPPLPWLESSVKERAAPRPAAEGLSPVEIRMVERISRQSMERGPYPLAELAHEPSVWSVFWACMRHVPSLFSFAFAYWRLSRVVRHPAVFDTPEFEAAFRRINPACWAHYPGFHLPPPPKPALP